MISGRTIFFSALDWGLGHATRSIPIIHGLKESNRIVLGVTPLNEGLFRSRFPDLECERLPSYNVTYSSVLPAWTKLTLQWPGFLRVIKRENSDLQEIIRKHGINMVISDSRYGLYNPSVHSVFITHQLRLRVPVFSFLANVMNRRYLSRFDEIWVPDHDGSQLSGELSDTRGCPKPVKFIGPKSRLADPMLRDFKVQHADILVLLSGVEPQRTILEKLIYKTLKTSPFKVVFIRGSHARTKRYGGDIQFIDFPGAEELKALIVNAGTVICRSGYSTLMDLHLLGKNNLVLIPTPGQTEQEYLAGHWARNFNAAVLSQGEIEKNLEGLLRTRSRPAR